MTQLYKAICGALLVIGLANMVPTPASAGSYYDSVCNCRRPDSEYTTRRYERAPARVVNHERVVEHTKVVRGNTRLIQENRLIVHVRPVINREVVVHRTNTVVKDALEYRVNTYVIEPPVVHRANCGCGSQHRGLLTSFGEDIFQ